MLTLATAVLAAGLASAPPPSSNTGSLDRREAPSAYREARAALARFDRATARKLMQKLPGQGREALELEWHLAHQLRDSKRIARAAAQLCTAGDPTGRACADAELYGGNLPRSQLKLLGERAQLPLVPDVPVPVAVFSAGQHKAPFVLDTGASQTVITARLAKELNLATTEASFPVGVAAGGGRAPARLAVLPQLTGGGFSLTDLPVLVIDMPELDAAGVGGIVSPQQAFDGLSVTLDLGQRRMALAKGPAPKPIAERSTVVPYLVVGFDLAVEAAIEGGPPALFGLDTGMPSAFAVAQGYQPGLEKVGQSVALHGAGGQSSAVELRGGSVRLGTLTLAARTPGILSQMPQADGLALSGLLGNGLWPDGALTLDTVQHTVALQLPDSE